MQASFEQFVVNKTGEEGQKQSYGNVALVKPGKFRWQIEGPTKQLIIANKNQLWIYDEDLAQVTKRKIDYSQPGNPAILLSGSVETLEKTFRIEKLKMLGVGIWFELRPKSTNNAYEWIKLHFVNGQIIAMYISDNLGQHSEIRFENIKANIDLVDKLFQFTPPKNVDVINEG